MPKAGPYYFAWVDQGTAFDPAVHNRMDEYIFSFKRTLREGDKPRLQLVIRNPHIGLLNSSRKQWAWFARDSESTAGIEPLFYGRLLATPKDIFKELITIDLVAWPADYFNQRQALAEAVKKSGPYDPVFIEPAKRDDPDTILEAISGLYHIDPVTHGVSISDVLNGEDGNVDITGDKHLYDEISFEVDQTSALTNILMVATVTWNQTGQGYIDMGPQTIDTFAGDAVISEWPKPLQSLGGGYTVATSSAIDSNGVASMVSGHASLSWTNKEREHSDGDCLSLNWSISGPAFGTRVTLTESNQTGILDPFAVDGDGDPSPLNVPPHYEGTFAYAMPWSIKTSLTLLYRDLERQRTERVQMLLQSDLQPILVDPLVQQNSEVIVKTGADVGIPILNVLNRTTLAGQHVDVDTIFFPDDPTLPGQRTAQIVTTEGILALVEPNYSDVPGFTTVDGTAVVTSLGTPAPAETAFDWPAQTLVGLGTRILPRKPLFVAYSQLTFAGLNQFPQVGTHAALGMIVKDSNGNYQVCTLSGLTQLTKFTWGTSRNAVTNDGSVQWTCLGPTLPDGKTQFLCVQAGRTGPLFLVPEFDNTLHARTTDNGVIWAAIGQGDIPAGGTPGDVWARSYFDTTRGAQSIEYLISIMRARARLKARAVTIGFTTIDPFGLGLELTLRKTATLHDSRLGGGIATGKLILIEHACDGDSGRETCRAEIGCAVGKDNVIEAVDGTTTYSQGDYDFDYEIMTGKVIVVGDASDVGYTPPLFTPNDDGLVFPLTKDQIVISEAIRGSQGGQAASVGRALSNMAAAARLASIPTTSLDFSIGLQKQIALLSSYSIQVATALNPIWYDAVLKPLSGWEFDNSYMPTLTKLTCAKGIDLASGSTP